MMRRKAKVVIVDPIEYLLRAFEINSLIFFRIIHTFSNRDGYYHMNHIRIIP